MRAFSVLREFSEDRKVRPARCSPKAGHCARTYKSQCTGSTPPKRSGIRWTDPATAALLITGVAPGGVCSALVLSAEANTQGTSPHTVMLPSDRGNRRMATSSSITAAISRFALSTLSYHPASAGQMTSNPTRIASIFAWTRGRVRDGETLRGLWASLRRGRSESGKMTKDLARRWRGPGASGHGPGHRSARCRHT